MIFFHFNDITKIAIVIVLAYAKNILFFLG